MVSLFILLIAVYSLFVAFVVTNCSKSPSERNKDFDNFL